MIFFKSNRIKQLEADVELLRMQLKDMLLIYLDFVEQYYQNHPIVVKTVGDVKNDQTIKDTKTVH